MYLGDDLVEARFLRRVNRFLAVVEMDGRESDVHVANSGRLRELFQSGASVWLKPARREGRKTAYDLALVEADGVLVSADARLPNALVAEAVAEGLLEGIEKPSAIVRESTFGESRFDLMLKGWARKEIRGSEVRNAGGTGRGAVSRLSHPSRRQHLNTLIEAVEAGHRAAVAFVVQRPDADAFAANEPADPALAESLSRAVACGVEAYAYNCRVSREEVRLNRRLPIIPFGSMGGIREPAP